MRQECNPLAVETAKLKLVLLGTTWHWPTKTLISVIGRRMIILGTTGWRKPVLKGVRLFHPPLFLTFGFTWG